MLKFAFIAGWLETIMRMARVVATALLLVSLIGNGHAAPTKKPVELADLVRGLLIDKNAKAQTYLVLKRFATDIHLVTPGEDWRRRGFAGNLNEFLLVYRGETDLRFNGKDWLMESMTDDQGWSVYLAGPSASPSEAQIVGNVLHDVDSLGPKYFLAAGFELMPFACYGYDPANYTGFFLLRAPGKQAAVLNISRSAGSAGVSYSYTIYWNGPFVSKLPQEALLFTCGIDD